jgi:hypothetical protein
MFVVNTSYTPAGAGGVGGVHDKIGFSSVAKKTPMKIIRI